MRLRAVFFDWGGTLAQVPPQLNRPELIWSSTCLGFDIRLAEAAIHLALDEVDRTVGPQIYAYVGRTREYWELYDGAVMDRLGIRIHRDEIEAAVQARFEDPSVVRLYPETRSVLDHLRAQGYPLGLISNHHDGLLDVLKYHGLDQVFESVTYSQEVGAEKPSPKVFERALKRAGCSSDKALHVGDSLRADVEGAQAFGLRAVWLNRDGREGVTTARTIRTLNELVPVVEQLAGSDTG
jgi:putative hydrolase of the HAD superfamily